MRVWRWYCHTHELGLLTMQTGVEPPAECSGLAELLYPDLGLCRFKGQPVLSVYTASPDPRSVAEVGEWVRYVAGGLPT